MMFLTKDTFWVLFFLCRVSGKVGAWLTLALSPGLTESDLVIDLDCLGYPVARSYDTTSLGRSFESGLRIRARS